MQPSVVVFYQSIDDSASLHLLQIALLYQITINVGDFPKRSEPPPYHQYLATSEFRGWKNDSESRKRKIKKIKNGKRKVGIQSFS